MKNKKKGFTLVELIVVLAILAILAAMLVPALTGYIDKANEKKVVAAARQYYIAAQTVVTDAYAQGKNVTSIELKTNAETEVKVDSSKNEALSADFKTLSEVKDGSTEVMTFTITDKKITGAVYKTKGTAPYTQAELVNGSWTVAKVKS